MTQADFAHLEQIIASEDEPPTSENLALVLEAMLHHPDDTVRFNCVFQLRYWDTPTAQIRAALLQMVQDWNFSNDTKKELFTTIVALHFSDTQMVDALSEHAADQGHFVASELMYTLCELGNPTPKAIQALTSGLFATEHFFAPEIIRGEAAAAIGKLGVSNAGIIAQLQHLARDPSTKEASHARHALEQLGFGAWVKGLDAQRLEQILESEDTMHTPHDYLLVLEAMQYHPDEVVRHNCIFQLKIWNDPKPAARDALLTVVKEWGFSSNTISELLETIQTLGFNDTEMVDALAKHITDRGYCVADSVAYTLGVLKNPTPEVVSALEWALSAGEMYFAEDFIRASAAWALGELGVSSPTILAGLQLLAKSPNTKEQAAAQAALQKLR